MKITKITTIFVYIIFFLSMIFSVSAAQTPVDLGTAENFVILSKSGISTTGTTSIVGNIGSSPIDSTAITGFDLIVDSSNEFATSSLINGKVYASDYSSPTPASLTTAISDMQTAYTDAAGRTLPDYTELGAGNIGGLTLTPGLYKWGTDVIIPTDVTLSGSSTDVWIFQIAQNLDISNGKQIHLTGGAQAKNVFWQVAGQTTIGTTAVFNGIILSQTAIVLNNGATLNGRALAQTAVTLDANSVSMPVETVATSSNSKEDNVESTENNAGTSSSTDNLECTAWSECNSEGVSLQTCSEPNKASYIKTQSCTPPLTQTNNNIANKEITIEEEKDSNIEVTENNQVNREITQELNEQIDEKKEEIKTGNYINSEEKILQVKELNENLKELRVNEIFAKTDLNITAKTNSNGKTKFEIMLQNGTTTEIKIMPDTASKIALEKLRIKVCSIENNCTIVLKEVGSSKNKIIEYEIKIERNSKILGVFSKKMYVIASVNAETGAVKINKPFWAFMAVEPKE